MKNLILLAEDSVDDQILLKQILHKAGVVNPIIVVGDGKEAIEHLKEPEISAYGKIHPLPKILFLDVRMPKIDGLEVLKWIKGKPYLKGMLVVVLSHYGEVGTIKRAYEQGAHSFLSKPFKLQDLYNLMKYYKNYWDYANPLPADAPLPHPSQELSGSNPQDLEIIS